MQAVLESTEDMARKRSTTGAQHKPSGKLVTLDVHLRQRIRDEISSRGWTQQQFAAKIQVSEGTVSNILGKQAQARESVLARIYDLFGWHESPDPYLRIVANLNQLAPEDQERIAGIVKSLARSR